MKKLFYTAFGCMCMLSASAQNAFTPGNLVVVQTTGIVSKASSAVTLKEYSPAGTAGLSIALPVTGPTPFQSSGVFGGSEGFLTTSTDGKYLALAGYATAATFADITATSAATANRAVGLVYPSGFYLQVDTSSSFYSANDIRGAVSDGTNFWASGASNATDGINYFFPGPDAALDAGAVPVKAYGMRIFNGQLYYSTQKAGPTNTTSQLGIFALGTGLPTSGSPAITQLINTGTIATSIIPQDFSINPTTDVCYIAVSLNTAAGGIEKWTRSGSVWSMAYLLGTGATNIGAYGLVVDYSGTFPVIYATTFEATGNRVIKIVDNGIGATATTIVPATTNSFFKGITFAPVASGTPIVNLSVSRDTASEAGASVITVTANASAPVSGNQTVTLGVTGSGITSGDYTLSGTTITILNGATSGSVTFTVTDDILGEGTEKATLTLSAPTSGIVLGMRPAQTITITDNDGNNPPTIVMSLSTTNFIDGGVAVSPASPFKLSGVINDPTDPGRTQGINFRINDLETAETSLTVTMTSSNTTVVPTANVVMTGTDSIRNIKITPASVGYSNITVSVTDGIDVTSYVINYAASAASTTPASTVWHTGLSDASDAVAIDSNYYVTGDDELNVLNVYSRKSSGLPLVSYNYSSNLALPDPSKPEADIEGATPSPVNTNRIYWMGSMSNGKAPFDNKPNRDRLFATTYTGTGASTVFTFAGYVAIKTSLLAWGDANGYNFTASAAMGVDSKLPSGFAAEGLVFGPDNTTLYVGMRAPLVPTATRTKAVIAPILNFEAWFNNGAPSGSPTYGAPIELNLSGRGIRDLIRLSNGTYVIVAGNPAGAPNTSAIYTWTGKAVDAPHLVTTSGNGVLNMEGAMQMNTGSALSLTSLQVITDQGDDDFYNDGNAAKDFGDLIYRKFRSDVLTGIDLSFPEINVQGNATTIVDGDVTPSTTDNTDFGNTTLLTNTTKTFVIQNQGSATLSVSGINFTGTGAANYSLVSAPTFPLNIASNGSQTITVKFAPTTTGTKAATLNILSNDADEATYDFALTGNGICNILSADTVKGTGSYCYGGAGLPVYISLSHTGVNYQMYNGAAAVGSPMAGNGGLLSFGLQTVAGTYTVIGTDAATNCSQAMPGSAVISIDPLPAVYTVTGGGHYCTGAAGISIGLGGSATGINYQLYRGTTPVGSPLAGTGSSLDFGLQTVAGSYSVVAINAVTGCSANMTGSAVVILDPLPAVYAITGSGTYCAGGTGVSLGIAASNTGINYQLYKGVTSVGASMPGTGSAISFGLQTAVGTYTVKATDATSGCISTLTGGSVATNPLPNVYNVTGSGSYCAGAAGVFVGLDSAETGFTYQLYKGSSISGSSVAGSNAKLTFGLQLAGTYTVVATNSTTGCKAAMNSSAVVVQNPLPILYSVTGGGTYCAGGTGFHVGVSNSENTVNYQLYRGTSTVGLALAGITGSALDYGIQTVAGKYTIVATNTGSGCKDTMNGSATIVVNPIVVPTIVATASPSRSVCAGTTTSYSVAITNGGTSPAYLWTVNGGTVSTSSSYSYIPVNGDNVSVRLKSNDACAVPDSAVSKITMAVTNNETPSISIALAGNDTVCVGTGVSFSSVPRFGGITPLTSWYVNGTKVATGSTYAYTPADHDAVYAVLTSNYACLATKVPAVSNNIGLSVTNQLIPAVSISVYPTIITKAGDSVTLTATVTNGANPVYQWYKGAKAITGATSSTLTRKDFVNNDSVTCLVTNTDACGVSSFNSVRLRIGGSLSVVNAGNVAISVIPNPNNGIFTVKGNMGTTDNAEVTLEVTNMLGQVVYSNKVMSHEGAMNEQVSLGNKIANGMYTLKVISGADNKAFHIVVSR